MKVLYIGHYREGGGWAKASIDYIQALHSVGVDVVCRNVSLTDKYVDVPSSIIAMENKSLEGVDYCIQHVLPHHLISTSKFKKNIAYFVYETNSMKDNDWTNYLKLVDEVWVANQSLCNVVKEAGVQNVKILPHCFNTDTYKKEYKKLQMQDMEGKFIFYYIGDYNTRKNIDSIIRCFHSEFRNQEEVALLVKINKFKVPPDTLRQVYIEKSEVIKESMRLYTDRTKFCKEVVVTEDILEDQIYSLHKTCDCFITISHGEAWSIPAFDAMAFGNTPICSNEGGPKDFIDASDTNTGSLIDGVYNVCNCPDAAFPHIFTGREEWFCPSESQTKKAMRYYYENRDNIDRSAGLKQAEKFSYEKIGTKIKEYLGE
jgi:glycosyltransferase involved in cell wall biosynthesis